MYKIACVHFDNPDEWWWEVLRKGFVKSVEQNTSAELDFRLLEKPKKDKRNWKLQSNNYKLKVWRDIVHEADKPVVLMDSDILVFDDIHEGFKGDVTLTTRPSKWINAGVVFCNPTQKAKDFMDAWVDQDEKLYSGNVAGGRPTNLMRAWRKTKVLGMNQTALSVIYPEWKETVGFVDGQEFNACQPGMWQKDTKVLHVKDQLQHNLLRAYKGKPTLEYKEVVDSILSYYL